MTESRFPVLDTVRGLGFLIVLFSHLAQARGLVATGMSQFGVWIFFVLSAFLLSYPFFEAPSRVRDPKAIKAYFLRRAFRIFPPLAFSLTAYWMVFPNYTWEKCVAHFLCVRVYGIFWTVFIETRYYLLLPLVVAAILALRSKPKVLFVVLAVGIALHLYDCPFWLPQKQWRAVSSGPTSTWFSREHLFVQYLPVFVGGTLLAALHLALAKTRVWSERWRRVAPIGFIVVLLAFAAISSTELGLLTWKSIDRWHYHGMWLPMIPLPFALVFSAATLKGSLERFCANPVFRYFGMISYSGYLFHEIFVKKLNPLIQSTALYVSAVLAATLAVATAGHYLIERPFMAFSRRS